MLFVFAGAYTPAQAKAEVVVNVRAGHSYHRDYHRRYYHRRYYHRHYYHRDYRR